MKMYYKLLFLLNIPRPLKELYSIFYDYIKDMDKIEGLYRKIGMLEDTKLISNKEYCLLSSNFYWNKPSNRYHSVFYFNERYIGYSYWWNNDEYYNPINRKSFVKHLINNHIK